MQCAICSHRVKWQEMCLPFTLSKMVNTLKEISHPLQISLQPFLGTAKKAFLLSDDSVACLCSFRSTLGFFLQYVAGFGTQVTCLECVVFFHFLIYPSNLSNFLSVFHYLFGANKIDSGTLVSCQLGSGEAV